MIKPILAATVLCFGLATAANAVPIKPSALPSAALASDLVEVGKKSYKGKSYKGKSYKGKYRAGGRYYYAPRGWRSYGARPYGWYGRGCIIIGPLWYCPW